MAVKETENKRDDDTGLVGFDDMNLRVGVILQMQQEDVSGKVQYGVRFIGAIPAVSFLATLPIRDDKAIWMRPGSPATFRVLSGTHVYAFATSVVRARSRPSSYAHFAIPEVVHSRTVRRHPRAEVRLPVEIERADGTRSMAILRDISLRGATVEMVGILASPGDSVLVDVPLILPELTRKLTLKALVRNCSDYEASVEKGRFRYGVEFIEIQEEDSIMLHYFINHLVAELHARC